MAVTLAKATDMYDTATLPETMDATIALIESVQAADPFNANNIMRNLFHNELDGLWFYYQATRNGFEYAQEGA